MSSSFTVEWTETASSDLDRILDFIEQDRPMAALRVLANIERRAAALRTHPQRGRIVPELAALQMRSYRELVITPYRLLYRIAERMVYVLGVFDGRRNLEDLLLERILSEGSSPT